MKTLGYLQDIYKKAVEICSKNKESYAEKVYKLVMEKAEKQFSKIPKDQITVNPIVVCNLFATENIDTDYALDLEQRIKAYFISKGFQPNKINYTDALLYDYDECGGKEEYEVRAIEADFS
jgi:hypothetical protein